VRQARTYPPTSATCVDAIEACHKAVVSRQETDPIVFRVTPRELLVGGASVGAGTIIEPELALRLHRAHVSSVEIDGTVLPRHLSRFCGDLIEASENRKPEYTLAEALIEHGVDTILATLAPRPEVLNVGAPPAPLRDLAETERARRDELIAAGGPPAHLYPPDKGWVRLDPTSTLESVSLVDLAVFVESPVDLANMLMRLTGDESLEADGADVALESKFQEVTTLFSALDPRLAAVMFARLSTAVLNLEPERRKALLQRTILPGLLDGNVEGRVLRDFPDVNLAESLSLLLDLETAAPEVLSAALDRLELPEERKQAVVPLLETHLQERASSAREEPVAGGDSSVGRRSLELLKIEAGDGKSFGEFMAFDLSVDDQARQTIDALGEEVRATDALATQLRCLVNLMRLEPNPSQIARLLARTSALLSELEDARRWQDVTSWIIQHQQLAEGLTSRRPDAAAVIGAALDAYCTTARVWTLTELRQGGDELRAVCDALVNALGDRLLPSALALLDDPEAQALARPLMDLMTEHAERLAPGLVARVGQCGPAASRAIAVVLGSAGPGHERAVASLLERASDEQTGRDALQALVRMGTPRAAAIVTRQIQQGTPRLQSAAAEALGRFPSDVVRAKLRELVGQREFVVRYPEITVRLLNRAARIGTEGLQPTLEALVPLRFRFWNPPLMRVGRAARAVLS
jgi:hypothetical protein